MAGVERHGEGKACEVWAWEAWAVEWGVRRCWGGCCRGTRQSLAKELPVAGATPAGHSEYRQKEPPPAQGLLPWRAACVSGQVLLWRPGRWGVAHGGTRAPLSVWALQPTRAGPRGWLASRHTP